MRNNHHCQSDGCFFPELYKFPAFYSQSPIPEESGDYDGKGIRNEQIFWNIQHYILILPSVMTIEIFGVRFAQSHGRAKINTASTGGDWPIGFYKSHAAIVADMFDSGCRK